MEKRIPKRMLEEIVTKHMLFDLHLEQIEALNVREQIIEAAQDYIVDDYFIFGPETIKDINNLGYKQLDEMEKNPPFVFAAAKKLMNPEGLSLALYYVEPLITNIMSEVSAKASQYIDPDKAVGFNIEFKSPEVIITNHIDIPEQFHEILVKHLNKNTEDLNTIAGSINFTKNVLQENGYLHLFSQQQSIMAFQSEKGIVFGEINDVSEVDYQKTVDKYQNIPVVTQEISLIVIERAKMIELIAKDFGQEKAEQVVSNFLQESPWVQFKVQPGSYNMNFIPSLKPLNDTEQKLDNDIAILFELKTVSLDKDLKVNTKLKM